MGNYMIDINLPDEFDSGFISLIPHQRAYIQKMMKKGVIMNYSVSMDRRKLWVLVCADSIQDVRNVLGSFPIFNYIRFSIYDLLFHESAHHLSPQFWLN